MDFKKPEKRFFAQFGDVSHRAMDARERMRAITDQRPPEMRVLDGSNPFYLWRSARKYDVQAMAQAVGLSTQSYSRLERGIYRGLDEEVIGKFCRFCDIHPAGLVEPGKPMQAALLNVLIHTVQTSPPHSRAQDLAVLALQSEIDDAHKAMRDYRAHCSTRAQMDLALPFLKLLEEDFALGTTGPLDPDEAAAIYMNEAAARLREKEQAATKPEFAHDPIWRTFSDAVLRLYGPNTQTAQGIENLRRPFIGFPNEWTIVCNLIRGEPEILNPLLWQDDMGPQFIGGRLLSREQTVKAMLDSYQANKDRDARLERAKIEANNFRSQYGVMNAWLKMEETRRLFLYWRNRQAAQGALGQARDALTPIAGRLPAPETPKV